MLWPLNMMNIQFFARYKFLVVKAITIEMTRLFIDTGFLASSNSRNTIQIQFTQNVASKELLNALNSARKKNCLFWIEFGRNTSKAPRRP